MARRQISDERKGLYYFGMILMVVGLLTFFSVFITGAANFGNFDNFEARGRSSAFRAIAGMGMMIVGGALMGVGRRGAAGSGLILDPEQAREDVEPWSRMTGGIVHDVLDEAGIKLGESDDDDDMPFDEKLRRLDALRKDGLINEQEYQAVKKKILNDA